MNISFALSVFLILISPWAEAGSFGFRMAQVQIVDWIGDNPNGSALALATDSSNARLVGGDFTAIGATSVGRMARIVNGAVDATFNANLGTGFNGFVTHIGVQSNGKILVAGFFTTLNGVAQNRVVLLNANGTKDATYNVGTGFDGDVQSAAQQSDGKWGFCGAFTSFNGTGSSRLARLNTNGSLDTGYVVGTGPNTGCESMAVQPSDDKFIIAGIGSYDGTGTALARVNTDGTLDTAFQTAMAGGFGGGGTAGSCFQPDGKIIVIGGFSTVGGVAQYGVARLSASGAPDATLAVGSSTNAWTEACAVLPNGQIVIVGHFSSYNGTAAGHIVRINSNGSVDAPFQTYLGAGFTGNIWNLHLSTQGQLMVAGAFTTFQGAGTYQKYSVLALP